jgi:nitroreductase
VADELAIGTSLIDEVLTTTRAVRRRLDLSRPVPKELLLECLEIAVQAPSGSNHQGWQFILISQPDRKQAIADYYRRSFAAYRSRPAPHYAPNDPRAERRPRVVASASYLADHMHEAPWLLIPCLEGRLREGASIAEQAAFWGSILPAFWSFMLAARARGLGTAWTTLHLAYEREVAKVLGIPYEAYTQAGLTPIAFVRGDRLRPAPRIPASAVIHWDAW